MKDRPKFRLADEESKDVRATLPQAYYNPVITVTVSQEAGWTVQQPDRLMATW